MSSWTWDKIRDGWFSTNGTAVQKASAVEAFNPLEDALDKIGFYRIASQKRGGVWGGGVGLDIILMADVLTTLRPIPFSAALIEKLRHRDRRRLPKLGHAEGTVIDLGNEAAGLRPREAADHLLNIGEGHQCPEQQG